MIIRAGGRAKETFGDDEDGVLLVAVADGLGDEKAFHQVLVIYFRKPSRLAKPKQGISDNLLSSFLRPDDGNYRKCFRVLAQEVQHVRVDAQPPVRVERDEAGVGHVQKKPSAKEIVLETLAFL